jgi:hypothetical protein
MKNTKNMQRVTATARGITNDNTGDTNQKEAVTKLTYFKVELALTFHGGGFLCRSESQEALDDMFQQLQPLGTPKSWDIGLDVDRPIASQFISGVDVYAVIPEEEASHLSDVHVGEQVEAALLELFRSGGNSTRKVNDEVGELIKGFEDITVEKVERATEPGEGWFGCPGFDDGDADETGGAA